MGTALKLDPKLQSDAEAVTKRLAR
jgi:hypothetical protein